MSRFTVRSKTLPKILPYILIIGGILGLLASFILTQDKIHFAENPDYKPLCSINPVISCGSITKSKQGSAFGFPNPFLGLAGFAMVVNVGVSMLAGGKFKKWYWRAFNAGTLFGFLFVHWLIYQSLFSIKALCLYCMLTWSVTVPIFWYTTLYNLREGNIPTPKKLKAAVNFAQRHHGDILLIWFLIIIGLILNKFWYYWSTLI